jgi:hypothetical protein
MMAAPTVLFAGAILAAAPAGSFMTGQQLLAACGSANIFESADCLGYITGIADAVGAFQPVLGERFAVPAVVCLRAGVTRGELRSVVVAHLREEPAREAASASALVVEALMQTYPCGDAGRVR